MEEAIRSVEEKEGIRVTWNVFPNTKAESQKNMIPLAFLYRPMHGYQDRSLLQVNYGAVRCARGECGGVLNPYSAVDFGTRHWNCLFCGRMNMLPPHYRDITPDNLPYELFSGNTSVYYRSTKLPTYSRTYWFVIDACSFDEERHLLLKEGLLTTLDLIAETDFIGVIRYSANIEVFGLDSTEVAKIHVFPAVNYTPAILQKALSTGQVQSGSPLSKFARRKSECLTYLENLFKNLPINAFPVPTVERPKRCTGSAVLLASSLVQSTCVDGTGHIMLFTQGPCTFGPGAITTLSLKDPLRSTGTGIGMLFAKESIYEGIAQALGRKGHVIDIVAAGIDDFGFSEMRSLAEKTGGITVFARDFNPYIYKESIRRIFAKAPQSPEVEEDLQSNPAVTNSSPGTSTTPPQVRVFDARTTVKISKGFEVKSVLGHGIVQPAEKKGSPLVWRQGSVFKQSSLVLVCEHMEDAPAGAPVYVQISTKFVDSTGECHERVTTMARSFVDATNLPQLVAGFDQEAATVFKAKELCVNADGGDGIDVIRQADRCLIRFMQRFCVFDRDVPSSLKTPPTIAFLPEFIFFLRRLPALHTDGLSFDEVAYQRNILLGEDSTASMCIIRPPLVSYHYTGERTPVELDSKSLKPDVALLVDTFYDVVIWQGENIVAWIDAGIKDDPEYWYFKEMLENIEKEAKAIVQDRLPVPKLTICNQYGSQERILLCKVNPSSSVANSAVGEGQTIVTEDIDFSRFYEYLIKLIVSS
ncbi:protein transport protein SEC23 [Nematocida homosporus]|uniref:protein transport protein SEC23 n=1 Tax=Nematocida homosporus TaxID=1912981 RepID=UPI00221F2D0D|nr:protein transport protein SEC23 [Nematocida homosporus]KAI5185298.1 protein transport protein SEC23 [Nematocida homosporus]